MTERKKPGVFSRFDGREYDHHCQRCDVYYTGFHDCALWEAGGGAQRPIRTFDSGATRDTDENKPDFEAFLAPSVLFRYGEYMQRHRRQPDGSLRDGDNWQKGIPLDAYKKSLVRHVFQSWGAWRGLDVRDEKDEPVDLQEALCAIIFNASGMLFELIRDSSDSPPMWRSGTEPPF